MGMSKYETNGSSHPNLSVIEGWHNISQDAIYSQKLLCSGLQRSHIGPFGHNLGPNQGHLDNQSGC